MIYPLYTASRSCEHCLVLLVRMLPGQLQAAPGRVGQHLLDLVPRRVPAAHPKSCWLRRWGVIYGDLAHIQYCRCYIAIGYYIGLSYIIYII